MNSEQSSSEWRDAVQNIVISFGHGGENKVSFFIFIKGSAVCWIWLWALGQGAYSMRPSYLWKEKVTRAKGMYVQRPEPLSQTEYNRKRLIWGFSQYLHADNTVCHGLWEKQLSRWIQVKTDWYSHKKVLSLESSKRKHFTPRSGVLSSPLKALVGAIQNSSFPYSQLQKHSSSVPVVHLNDQGVFCQVNMT